MHTDPTPYNVMYGFCSTTFALIFLYKLDALLRLRRRGRPYRASWPVVISFASTAVAFTFAIPALYLRFDEAIGVSNAATVGVYTCIVITSAAFEAVTMLWVGKRSTDRQIAARLSVYAGVIVSMLALFLIGDASDGEHPLDFDAHFAATPWISEFLLIYYATFGVAMGHVSWLAWRYSGSAGGWLGRGLRWLSVGSGFAVGYVALKVVAVAGIMGGADLEMVSTQLAPLSASIGAVIMAVGLTMPTWGPALGEGLARFRHHRDLYPLWRVMTDAVPRVVLQPAGPWAVRHLKHRLHRRVLEINDARRDLGPYLDPQTGTEAGLREEDFGQDHRRFQAAQEAAMLAAATVALRAGAPAAAGSSYPAPGELSPEWDQQLSWLLLVSREYTRLDTIGPPTTVPSEPAMGAKGPQ